MQRVAVELYEALARHPGVDLDALILRSSWSWTHLRTGPFLLRAYRGIRRRTLNDAIDVVLFSSMVTAALATRLHRTLAPRGIPMAAIVHGRDVTLPVGPYQRFIPHVFDALDAVLPVSRATGGECVQRGLPEAKLDVVPNGVDLRRFPPLDGSRAMRRALLDALDDPRHPLPDEALLLCSVGRQVERKGFAWFIEQVMPQLPQTVHYWLAGDGPEAERIAEAAARQGMAHRVRRLGRISEEHLSLLYRGADLFVMPNIPVQGDIEGFGVVMLEAGLSGLPVVAARLEGIQDVITEGINGHFVASGDAGAFADAILCYHQDRPLLEAAAHRARAHIAATFSWNAVADRYVQVLQGLKETAT